MPPAVTLVSTYAQMLRALAAWLDKTDATLGRARAEETLAARLAPDMHPLASQIRFCCYQAQEAPRRLRGEALPPALEALAHEGWAAADAPGSIADAQARLDEALAYLDGLASDALDDGAARMLTLELPGGLIFDLSGADYARDWALPQFYFHLVTAYAILRARGVNLGKADYVPHMSAYRR